MRFNIFRMLGTLLAVTLVAPAGFLFSVKSQQQLPGLNSETANWAATEQATSMFNHIQDLARQVRKEVGPLQVQGQNLYWQDVAARLDRVRHHVNQMGNDLLRLSDMKKNLQPWQQELLDQMKPKIHELVYQTDAAIKVLKAKKNTTALATTNYPQYIDIIANRADQLTNSVGRYTQYVRAAENLAMTRRQNQPQAE